LEKLKNGLLGKLAGYVYTIEFQKHELPHIHILLFLHPESQVQTPEMVDRVFSAQIPDPQTHPRLHQLVTKLMVHGPCGEANPNATCMKDGKCSKGYPKPFQTETTMAHDGYTLYARPDNGRTFVNEKGIAVDNRWIVPHCPLILMMMESHANLECCV